MDLNQQLSELVNGYTTVIYKRLRTILSEVVIDDTLLDDALEAMIDKPDEVITKTHIDTVFDDYSLKYLASCGFIIDSCVYRDANAADTTELIFAVYQLADISEYVEELSPIIENTNDDVMYVILKTLNGYLNMDTYFTLVDAVAPSVLTNAMEVIVGTPEHSDEMDDVEWLGGVQLKAVSTTLAKYNVKIIPLEIASREYNDEAGATIKLYKDQYEAIVVNLVSLSEEDDKDEDEFIRDILQVTFEYISSILPYMNALFPHEATLRLLGDVMDILKENVYLPNNEVNTQLQEAIDDMDSCYRANGVYH